MKLSVFAFTNILCIADMKNDLLQSMKSDFLEYTQRISKSFRYIRMPDNERPSLPLSELMISKINEDREETLDLLQLQEVASVSLGASVTPCSMIVALIYIERIKTLNPEYFYNTSPSDIFVVALLLAGKYLYDAGEEHDSLNQLWALYSSKPVDVINNQEMLFLDAINWSLFVNDKQFSKALKKAECIISMREGCKRGFFTYGDLISVNVPSLLYMCKCIWFASKLCVVVYASVIFTVAYGVHLSSSPATVSDVQNISTPISVHSDAVPPLEAPNVYITENYMKPGIELFENDFEPCRCVPTSDSTNVTNHGYLSLISETDICRPNNHNCSGTYDYIRIFSDQSKNTRKSGQSIAPPLYNWFYIEGKFYSLNVNSLLL